MKNIKLYFVLTLLVTILFGCELNDDSSNRNSNEFISFKIDGGTEYFILNDISAKVKPDIDQIEIHNNSYSPAYFTLITHSIQLGAPNFTINFIGDQVVGFQGATGMGSISSEYGDVVNVITIGNNVGDYIDINFSGTYTVYGDDTVIPIQSETHTISGTIHVLRDTY